MENQITDKQTIHKHEQAEYYTHERTWLIVGAKKHSQLGNTGRFYIRGKFRLGCERGYGDGTNSVTPAYPEYIVKTDAECRFKMLEYSLTEYFRHTLPTMELDGLRGESISIVSPVPEFLATLKAALAETFETPEDMPTFVKYLSAFKKVVAVTVTLDAARNLFTEKPDQNLLREILP